MLNALGYVGFGVQTVEGTPVAPTFFLPYDTLTAPEQIKMITRRNGYTRDLSLAARIGQFTNLTLKAPLFPKAGGALLAYAMGGTDTVTGAGDPYTHALTLASGQLPFVTFEVGMGNGTIIHRIPDCLINTFKFNLVGGQIVDLDITVMGRLAVRQTSAATVTFETDRMLSFLDAALTFTGLDVVQTDVSEASIEINNGVAAYTPTGAFAPRYLAQGREMQLSGKVLVPDDKLYREINWGSASGTTAVSPPTYLTSLVTVYDLSGSPDHRVTTTMRNVEMEMGTGNWDVNASAWIVSYMGKAIKTGSTVMLDASVLNGLSTAYM
jgi:hypothetical protein